MLAVALLLGVHGIARPGVPEIGAAAQGPDRPVTSPERPEPLAFVTYAAAEEQVRAVRALIRSVRERGGPYAHSRVFVVLGDPAAVPGTSLKGDHVELVPVAADRAHLDYPLAIKAFAAAQVEGLLQEQNCTLVWCDPGVLVLQPPAALDLGGAFDVAVRPVSLANTIGLAPGTPPDNYWTPIYQATGLDYRNLPAVESIVDHVQLQPYFNCEVFAVNPRWGLCAEWARILSELLGDPEYQKNACPTFLKRLFLHQAVLSAVLQSRVAPGRLRPLPLANGYPFEQHPRLAEAQRVASLDDVSVVILDTAWQRSPNWLSRIGCGETLRSWLADTYLEYLTVAPNLSRREGSCKASLAVTPGGGVLIDPAGAAAAPEYFKKVLDTHPLRAILLTPAHDDHSAGIASWQTDPPVPVIAQRQFPDFRQYQAMLGGFFARRNAIWAGQPIPAEAPAPAAPETVPTVLFADEYTLELGGFHFRLIHTPGETPDHATIWIPELSAVCVGDNYYEYFINNATFRGTQIRPMAGYIHALDTALSFQPELFLPGHGAPVVGRPEIARTVGNFHDALKFVLDATVKGINAGQDVYTLMREVRLPPELQVGQFYGKVPWTVRGIYQEYVGWFDENPATMYDLPPSSIYPDLVTACGAAAILGQAEAHLARKEYVAVLHLTEVVLKADPQHGTANDIRRQALEALKGGTRNYIERIWLDYGLRSLQDPPRANKEAP